jgi:hypothetical protein
MDAIGEYFCCTIGCEHNKCGECDKGMADMFACKGYDEYVRYGYNDYQKKINKYIGNGGFNLIDILGNNF